MSHMRVVHVLEASVGGTARHLELVTRHLPGQGVDLACVVSPLRQPAFPTRLREVALAAAPGPPPGGGAPDGQSEVADPALAAAPAAAAAAAAARPVPDAVPPPRIHDLPMRREISAGADLVAYRRLKRLLRAEAPDLVHTHSSKAGFLGRRAARALGLPVVHTPHTMPMEWSGSWLYLKLEQWAAGWTDRLIILNDRQEQLAREALGLPAERLARVPNGVDLNEFFPPSPTVFAAARDRLGIREMRPLVGLAARLEPQKGVGEFLRAARLVLEEVPRTIFLIAGEGSLRPELEERCRRDGLGKAVRFLGAEEHMPSFYHALDLLVLASLWEGMPYSILEAQATGLPVVASATPGAQELLRPGENGTLVPLGNAEALASAVCTYLRDERLRERHGRRGREGVLAEHTVQTWAGRLADLYREVAGR
jgi:glycosyltransferase involved in cell wall biosynthesis